MLLKQAIEFTCSVRKSWMPDSKGSKTALINAKHCVDVLGNVDVSEIDAMSFINIQECLTAEGKTPATVNRITSALSTILTVMVQHKIIKDKPGFSQLKEPRGRQVFYSDEEMERMLIAADTVGGEIKDVLLFASKCGARRGEIENLKWDEIDFTKNELTFRETKNGDDRVLPLGGELLELVERLHRDRVSENVFNINGPQMLAELRKVQKLSGVSSEKSFHSIRHTCATNLWAKGANLIQVKEILGHRNAATSVRYSHADMKEKAKGLALL